MKSVFNCLLPLLQFNKVCELAIYVVHLAAGDREEHEADVEEADQPQH